MAVNIKRFPTTAIIELWSEAFTHLAQKAAAQRRGHMGNFRALALKGFIYIDISLHSVAKRHHRRESFTTNKTHRVKKKIQKAL